MKSTEFFTDKAKQYISDIDLIISEYKEFDLDTRLSSFSNNTSSCAIQESSVSELKLKIKLLFSEFDKGEFFIDEIKKVDENVMLWCKEEEKLNSYESILELFIDHINQFRN